MIFLEWIERCEISNIYYTDFLQISAASEFEMEETKQLVLYFHLSKQNLNPLSFYTICNRKKIIREKIYISSICLLQGDSDYRDKFLANNNFNMLCAVVVMVAV